MVYYNPYKKIVYAFARALKTFLSCLFSKSLLIFIIVFLLVFIFVTDKKVEATSVDFTDDIFYEITESEYTSQDDFVLWCYNYFLSQNGGWTDILKPFFDELYVYNYDIHCLRRVTDVNNHTVTYTCYLYYKDQLITNNVPLTYRSKVSGSRANTTGKTYDAIEYNFIYNTQTDSLSRTINIPTTGAENLTLYDAQNGLKSQLLIEFMGHINGYYQNGAYNYLGILNTISNYLNNIDTSSDNIYTDLQSILSLLSTIAQNSPIDYSQQIGGISSQISSIIQQQEEIADNTAEMIQQQEEIKTEIEDLNDFLNDSSYNSNTITNNMPTNTQQDITETGFDNIFTTLRNTFTGTNYQDLVITVPFTNGGHFTIPSNITENIVPDVLKALIRLVYWYLISRYIVKDIASYIEKAKSGDIFDSSDSNIKTEML